MNLLKAINLNFRYKIYNADQKKESFQTALNGVDLTIEAGDFIGILGQNGSGKSTLAKQLAALLTPTEGYVYIDGLDSRENSHSISIRQKVGMVFQNPDNQIVGNVVEEDVAFGPENLGLPREEILGRVERALEAVSMNACRYTAPGRLSGGQKQKIAIAGILAMEPKCIILDEPTAMLDPQGKKEVLEAIHCLNQEKKVTIILITHHIEEVENADTIYLMKEGKILIHGSPEEIWCVPHLLKDCGIRLPFILRLSDLLRERNILVPQVHDEQELLEYLTDRMASDRYQTLKEFSEISESDSIRVENAEDDSDTDDIDDKINCEHISYSYEGRRGEKISYVLQDISLSVKKGEYLAIVGKTGSGKSTLLQHLNGLLKPSLGKCYYDGEDIHGPDISLKEIRQKVALCFQYPEYQLFEETVLKDVCFGPANMGCPRWVCLKRAREAMEQMGISSQMESLSPLTLSGGQKRKVALAGILAMEPEFLVLDEPAAGMDQPGKDNLFHLLKELNEEKKTGIIFVSHDMDDVAEHADRVIVMDRGRIFMDGKPREVFSDREKMNELNLEIPQVLSFYYRLRESDFGSESNVVPVTLAELADYIRWELTSHSTDHARKDV